MVLTKADIKRAQMFFNQKNPPRPKPHKFVPLGVALQKALNKYQKRTSCNNCQGQNAKTGYVENWDGICPDCGRTIRR